MGTKDSRVAETFPTGDMSEMTLRLAHELRNPLATIKSAAQLIRRLRMSPDDALPYLDGVIREVARIDETIRGMEEFASLAAGTRQPVAAEEAVSQVLASFKNIAKEVDVSLVNAGGPPAVFMIDPKLLKLALKELLDNAIRFSTPSSQVSVSWQRTSEQSIQLHVDDQGCGITPEVAQNIFRLFYSTSTQGNGLGLNVVNRICRLAGGRLEWENRPEGGCRFTMIFPEV